MQFSFSGSPEVTASREAVWERLMDPTFVTASAPGVESIERIDPTHFKLTAGLGLGAMKLPFQLDISLLDLVKPESATLEARGHAAGSDIAVRSTIRLTESRPGHTRIAWTSESSIDGGLVAIGGRLLEGMMKKVTEQFWEDFARRVSVA